MSVILSETKNLLFLHSMSTAGSGRALRMPGVAYPVVITTAAARN
jgi:hypothetical protein